MGAIFLLIPLQKAPSPYSPLAQLLANRINSSIQGCLPLPLGTLKKMSLDDGFPGQVGDANTQQPQRKHFPGHGSLP
jgi:hypothetical protein